MSVVVRNVRNVRMEGSVMSEKELVSRRQRTPCAEISRKSVANSTLSDRRPPCLRWRVGISRKHVVKELLRRRAQN